MPLPGSLSQATPIQATLDEINSFGLEMVNKKSSRIFKVVRSFGDAPILQHLPFGHRCCAVLNGMKTDPYILGTMPCVQLAPKIQLQKYLIELHQLHKADHFHPNFELQFDQFMANYKMHCLTQKHKSLEKSWKKQLDKGNWSYEDFIAKLLGMTRSFDLYCITLINDVSKISRENISRNYLLFDHHIEEIINTIQNFKKANVLGIVGKWETNSFQQINLKLLFFVSRETSDFVTFEETGIYKCLNQFIDQTGLIQTMWTAPPQFLMPNFYNVNQINFGKRLQILKAYLIGTDHYVRIFDDKSTCEILYCAQL
jgi:hypothetical protein